MIYLDVTSSCKSPLNTGVQRMVRGIFAGLDKRTAVTPLLWSPKLNSYCELSDRERQFLVEPFARHQDSSATPETLSARFPWSKTVRYLRNRKHRFALDAAAAADDVLLVPEIFQDNRTRQLALVKSWFAGRSYAVLHDAIPMRSPEMSKPQERRTFPEYVRALASFDKVICPSREVETDLNFFWDELKVRKTQTAVQGWPTDFGRDRPLSQPNPKARRILCVASLHQRKNHLRLLEAAELLWNEGEKFELILVGRTTSNWGPTVIAEIKRLSRKGRKLKWLLHIDEESLHRAYQECSFTVYPSIREGFGLPILESLWHGRPCICGTNGALGEVAAGGGCLPVNQENVSSLAKGMRQLLNDPSIFQKLYGEACQRTFCNWEDYIAKLLREIGLQ